MRLKSFRVRKFRNIVDSGKVRVDRDVTCLIGKNEAGKSALLEALWLLNPSEPATFNFDAQYPIWMQVSDRRNGVDVTQVTPITARFRLDSDDRTAVEAVLGDGVLNGSKLRVGRTYGGEWTFRIQIDELAAVRNVVSAAGSTAGLPSNVTNAQTLAELSTATAEALPGAAASQQSRLQAIADNPAVTDGQSAHEVAFGVLVDRIPAFFRATEYSTIPGTMRFDDLRQRQHAEHEGLEAARALLSSAEIDLQSLTLESYDARRTSLNAVSIDITNQVFEYWTQNDALSVVFATDSRTVDTGSGPTAVVDELHILVKDSRTGYDDNFGKRSNGFQWFFSFFAAYSQFEGDERPPIVLLDEPGLSLHGRAQADYLRFIDEKLAPATQVLYTTHSPFMVPIGQLHRTRLVEDRGADEWSVVVESDGALSTDSLFPLQAALGYDIAQSLFVGPNNLVVEGISDFLYLRGMSDILEAAGQPGLDERIRILPAGGATNVPTFVALIGPHLDVMVLTDSSSKPNQKIEGMVRSGVLNEGRRFAVGSFVGTTNADIEDMFEVSDYLSWYNAEFGSEIEETELPPGDRIVDRLVRHRGVEFNHNRPATRFSSQLGDHDLSQATLDRFAELFSAINAEVRDT